MIKNEKIKKVQIPTGNTKYHSLELKVPHGQVYTSVRSTIVSESEFWKQTALQQQVIIHAKNKT